MFIFEGLEQKQEDRVEVQSHDRSMLIVSVFIDEPKIAQVQITFSKVVFFSRSIFPGPSGVRCDMSQYQLRLGRVSCLEKSELAADYKRYYSSQIVPIENLKHFIIVFDGIGEIFHVVAQSFVGESLTKAP